MEGALPLSDNTQAAPGKTTPANPSLEEALGKE